MRYPRTAAGYAEYLQSEHWDRLRSVVLARDGNRCVHCGGFAWQVHHKFYREDWESAQPSDCESVCRPCHEKEHPEKVQAAVVDTLPQVARAPHVAPESTAWLGDTGGFETMKQLERARSKHQVTREEFLRFENGLIAIGRAKQRKRKRSFPRKKRLKVPIYSPRLAHSLWRFP